LPSASELVGTSAQLLKDDLVTIEELIYGMMLPSGNDAAESLALYFGVLIQHKCQINPNLHLTDLSEDEI